MRCPSVASTPHSSPDIARIFVGRFASPRCADRSDLAGHRRAGVAPLAVDVRRTRGSPSIHDRKIDEGKTPKEAIRALKRRALR